MESLFKLATEIAASSPSKKKVGAVLLKKNRVIVCATNNETKTHPIPNKTLPNQTNPNQTV